MPRILMSIGFVIALAFVLAARSPVAGAGYGGGYGGSSGNGLWSLAWWAGSPEGPGPYVGPQSDAAGQCIWHDVGGSLSGLGSALSEASLPESFWLVPQSGGHPGIWGVLAWALAKTKHASGGDHFDVVACPSPGEVPPNSATVESDLPRASPPGSGPLWLWVFWDTVADPPPWALPPVVDEALSEARLPAPMASTSPSQIDGVGNATVVNLPTWLWIDPAIWHRWSATADAGAIRATVWAYPSTVTWSAYWDFPAPQDDPEHGTTLGPEQLTTECPGPGVAYSPSLSLGTPGVCTAVFAEPTLGTWQALRASVTWVVHWAVSNAAGVVGGEGLLPDSVTSSRLSLRVMQVESIISSG
ncbi:MAG: hypothetical protein ACYCSF_11940 [Acidimicrobiales bacterium]